MKKPKSKKAKKAKMKKVMDEFKAGTLKSGGTKKVILRKQAIAIALSESGQSKKKKKKKSKRYSTDYKAV